MSKINFRHCCSFDGKGLSSVRHQQISPQPGVKNSPSNCVIVTGGPGNRLSSRAVVRGGVLTFTTVDPADQGEYTCKALNTHGEHMARVSLIVQSMFSCVGHAEGTWWGQFDGND